MTYIVVANGIVVSRASAVDRYERKATLAGIRLAAKLTGGTIWMENHFICARFPM